MNTQGFSVFVVGPTEAGQRLDLFLSRRVEGLSRSQAAKHVSDNAVLVESRSAKPSLALRAGDRITYQPPPLREGIPKPEKIPLKILFEDEYLAVIEKDAGVVVHPSPGHSSGTLVNAVLHHCDDLSGIGGVRRPGIVHRLDKDTTGLLVVAKTDEAHLCLSSQFKDHSIERRYLAIVSGSVEREQGRFITGHRRHPKNRKKFTTRYPVGTVNTKRAETHYRLLQRLKGACLVEAKLETGRTHQVRVHFAENGHPLLGDPLYGKPLKGRSVKTAADSLGRQALHAAVLGFGHPAMKDKLLWVSRMPEDMESVFSALGGTWPIRDWPPVFDEQWRIMKSDLGGSTITRSD